MGKFILTIPAKPFMGKIKSAFCDSLENFFSHLRGFATQGGKSDSSAVDLEDILSDPDFNENYPNF